MKALLELSMTSGIRLPRKIVIKVTDKTIGSVFQLRGKHVRKVERGMAHVEEILAVTIGADKVADSGDWGVCPFYKSFSHFVKFYYLEVYEHN